MLSTSVRLCNVSLTPAVKASVAKLAPFVRPQPYFTLRLKMIRTFADKKAPHQRFTLKHGAMNAAYFIGKGALAGGSGLALGALCYYGQGLSNKSSALDESLKWPRYTRDRIKSTYLYFGGSVAISAVCAAAALRSPAMLHFITQNTFTSFAVTFAVMIGSGMLVQRMPYKKGFGVKKIAWMAHTAILGCTIAPICLIGGPIITRAAWYTVGVVGGLSILAVCAPSEKFLTLGGPLAIGLGVVLASTIGNIFLPPTTTLGAGLYSVSLYGGLLLFSVFVLYDTQRIIKMAENYPLDAPWPYDPINAAMSIYLDTLNIFIRIAIILASGGDRRRK